MSALMAAFCLIPQRCLAGQLSHLGGSQGVVINPSIHHQPVRCGFEELVKSFLLLAPR